MIPANIDREGLIALAESFGQAVARVGTVGDAWIDVDVQRAFQASGISLCRNHYYSVFPDLASLPDGLWADVAFARAWSAVKQDDYGPLLDRALSYRGELEGHPRESTGGFYWNNPMFPPLDAAVYHGLIRELKPRRILEIGSGFSTLIALDAVAANGSGSVACIEPNPRPELLAREDRLLKLCRLPVQKVPDSMFQDLEIGDFLFIDTSHASKPGSDVHDILFRILPLLRPGVVVHIHDVFLPYEYPRAWYDQIGIVWNEQYLVLALLMNSNRYRVTLPNYLASIDRANVLKASFAGFDIEELSMNLGGPRGASLWLRVEA